MPNDLHGTGPVATWRSSALAIAAKLEAKQSVVERRLPLRGLTAAPLGMTSEPEVA